MGGTRAAKIKRDCFAGYVRDGRILLYPEGKGTGSHGHRRTKAGTSRVAGNGTGPYKKGCGMTK